MYFYSFIVQYILQCNSVVTEDMFRILMQRFLELVLVQIVNVWQSLKH